MNDQGNQNTSDPAATPAVDPTGGSAPVGTGVPGAVTPTPTMTPDPNVTPTPVGDAPVSPTEIPVPPTEDKPAV